MLLPDLAARRFNYHRRSCIAVLQVGLPTVEVPRHSQLVLHMLLVRDLLGGVLDLSMMHLWVSLYHFSAPI